MKSDFGEHKRKFSAFDFSDSGKPLVLECDFKRVDLLNFDTGENLYLLAGDGVINGGRFKKKRLAVAVEVKDPLSLIPSQDIVNIYNTTTAERVQKISYSKEGITSRLMALGNKHLAMGTRRSPSSVDAPLDCFMPLAMIKVLDIDTLEFVFNIENFGTHVSRMKFSPDDRQLAMATFLRRNMIFYPMIKLINLETGDLAHLLEEPSQRGGFGCLSYSPDGEYLASGAKDGRIFLWNARKGQLLRELESHKDSIVFCAFSPDEAYFVSGSKDKTVQISKVLEKVEDEKMDHL